MGQTRILIVDDHEIFRRGIRSLLEASPDIVICGEASSGLEALEKAKEFRPDVVLMDISMQGITGLDATRLIRSEVPNSKIIILSQHDSLQMQSAATKMGASAFVTKSQAARSLIQAIDAVIKGQPYDWRNEDPIRKPRASTDKSNAKPCP